MKVTNIPLANRLLEEWRDVVGTNGLLRVSNLGRVMRMRYAGIGRRSFIKEPFTPKPPKNTVSVPNRGVIDVACLVLEAFIGLCPEGMECCHYDDDRSNNKLSNLRWDTHSNNVRDGYRNGAKRSRSTGDNLKASKLSNELVALARQMRSESPDVWTYDALAEVFGVHRITIRKAVNRLTWRHVV